jgi:hypothetical protein
MDCSQQLPGAAQPPKRARITLEEDSDENSDTEHVTRTESDNSTKTAGSASTAAVASRDPDAPFANECFTSASTSSASATSGLGGHASSLAGCASLLSADVLASPASALPGARLPSQSMLPSDSAPCSHDRGLWRSQCAAQPVTQPTTDDVPESQRPPKQRAAAEAHAFPGAETAVLAAVSAGVVPPAADAERASEAPPPSGEYLTVAKKGCSVAEILERGRVRAEATEANAAAYAADAPPSRSAVANPWARSIPSYEVGVPMGDPRLPVAASAAAAPPPAVPLLTNPPLAPLMGAAPPPKRLKLDQPCKESRLSEEPVDATAMKTTASVRAVNEPQEKPRTKPRGRPPLGKEWDASVGMYVALQPSPAVEIDSDAHPRLTNPSTGTAAPSPHALAPTLVAAPAPAAAPPHAVSLPPAVALPQSQPVPRTSHIHAVVDDVVSVALEDAVQKVEDEIEGVEDEVEEVGDAESSRRHVANADGHAQQRAPTSGAGAGSSGGSGGTVGEKLPRVAPPIGTTTEAAAHTLLMTAVALGPEREAMAHKLATQYRVPGLSGDALGDALANCVGQPHVAGQLAKPLADVLKPTRLEPGGAPRSACVLQQRRPRKAQREASGEPKLPMTAYMLFTSEVRASFQAYHTEANPLSLAKLMGERWKKMSDEQKVRRRCCCCRRRRRRRAAKPAPPSAAA